jgi:deoxyhypusine synthase
MEVKEMKPVKDISLDKNTTLKELAEVFNQTGGFVARKLGTAVNIMNSMLEDKDCLRILSFPACIVSTGTRGIIKELVKRKMFDLIITTCGTLDHDFARTYKDYFHGIFEADDKELHRKGVNRLGNVFIPHESHGEVIEEKLQPILQDMYDSGKRGLSTYEFAWEVGKRLQDKDSILCWAYKNEIPVIIPGITDGTFGTQLLMFMQEHRDFKIDVFRDEEFLSGKLFGDVKSGALIIGGGISKHHVIWWSQFGGGLNYSVYLTTAVEHDGSLSGARTREAISWGKIKEDAKHITVEGDATVLLPLLVGPFL